MINKKYKMSWNFLLAGALILILSSLVSAIGVGSGYSIDLPLELYPGEERAVTLGLANIDVEGSIFLEGIILEGNEIASLDSGPYEVSYNIETPAKMNVKIPASANIGNEYLIRYKFMQVSGGKGSEGVTFSQSIERVMKVVVVEKSAVEPTTVETPVKETKAWVWVGLVLIILIGLGLWWLVKKKKQE